MQTLDFIFAPIPFLILQNVPRSEIFGKLKGRNLFYYKASLHIPGQPLGLH